MNRSVHILKRLAGAAALALALAAGARAAAADAPTLEYQVKAAYVYNLAKFVDWPAQKFATPEAPLIIGVVGDDPFNGYLDQLVQNKTINGHPLEVRHFTLDADLKACHVLFVSRSRRNSLDSIFSATRAASVLTVSEIEKFARRGGDVSLLVEDESVKLEVNLRAAQAADLKISSKLLSIARVIKDDRNSGGATP